MAEQFPYKPPDLGMEFASSADRTVAPARFELLTEDRLQEVLDIGRRVFPAEDIAYFNRYFLNTVRPQSDWDDTYNNLDSLEAHTRIVDGQIIGIVGIKKYKDEPNEAWLSWIFRNQAYTGGKVGVELMNFAINRAKELGCDALRLLTSDHPDFRAAHTLYNNLGFVQHKVTEFPPSNDRTNFEVYSFALDGSKAKPFVGKLEHFADEQPFEEYVSPDEMESYGLSPSRTQETDARVRGAEQSSIKPAA